MVHEIAERVIGALALVRPTVRPTAYLYVSKQLWIFSAWQIATVSFQQ